MAMRPTHDLMVKTGTYTDRDGNQKNRWLKIGARFVRDDGSDAFRLDCVPVGLPDWNGWISAYPIKPRGEGGTSGYAQQNHAQPAAQQPASAWDDGEDIPF